MSTTQEFKTDTGYIYKSLPHDFDIEEHGDLFNEAPKYRKVKSALISHNYAEYLRSKLKMVPADDNQMAFFIGLKEGHINFFDRGNINCELIVLWVEKGTAEHKLWKAIKSDPVNIPKNGLQYLLDPNTGGSLSKEILSLANLIVFG